MLGAFWAKFDTGRTQTFYKIFILEESFDRLERLFKDLELLSSRGVTDRLKNSTGNDLHGLGFLGEVVQHAGEIRDPTRSASELGHEIHVGIDEAAHLEMDVDPLIGIGDPGQDQVALGIACVNDEGPSAAEFTQDGGGRALIFGLSLDLVGQGVGEFVPAGAVHRAQGRELGFESEEIVALELSSADGGRKCPRDIRDTEIMLVLGQQDPGDRADDRGDRLLSKIKAEHALEVFEVRSPTGFQLGCDTRSLVASERHGEVNSKEIGVDGCIDCSLKMWVMPSLRMLSKKPKLEITPKPPLGETVLGPADPSDGFLRIGIVPFLVKARGDKVVKDSDLPSVLLSLTMRDHLHTNQT